MNKETTAKYFKIAVLASSFILIASISFTAGMAVGFRKAKFSFRFGENYERNFAGPGPNGPAAIFRREMPGDPRGFLPNMPDMGGRDFRNSHGLAGSIISISDQSLIVKDRDDKENTVSITDKTIIKHRSDDLKISDLKNDDKVVVIGSPADDGVVNAEFIRVFRDNEFFK